MRDWSKANIPEAGGRVQAPGLLVPVEPGGRRPPLVGITAAVSLPVAQDECADDSTSTDRQHKHDDEADDEADAPLPPGALLEEVDVVCPPGTAGATAAPLAVGGAA